MKNSMAWILTFLVLFNNYVASVTAENLSLLTENNLNLDFVERSDIDALEDEFKKSQKNILSANDEVYEQHNELSSDSEETMSPIIQSIPDNNFNMDDWDHSYCGYGYYLKKYKGNETNLYIPATYNGKRLGLEHDPEDGTNRTGIFNNLVESIYFEPGVIAGSSGYLFSQCSSLRNVNIQNLDFTYCINMSHWFDGCTSLESISLEDISTSSDFKYMNSTFQSCTSLREINLNGFSVENVEDMGCLFMGCEKLETLDLSQLYKANPIRMQYMFSGCKKLKNIDFTGFDTSRTEIMAGVFKDCIDLEEVNLAGFNTSKVIGMSNMFSHCSSLQSLDLSNFDTSKVTDMREMFYGCSSLQSLDVSNFDTSKVTDMSWMFSHCSSLQSIDVSTFETSNVKDIGHMFDHCSSLQSLDVSNFDTSNVENMSWIFYSMESIRELDLSSFCFRSIRKDAISTDWLFFGDYDALEVLYTPRYVDTELQFELPQYTIDKRRNTKSKIFVDNYGNEYTTLIQKDKGSIVIAPKTQEEKIFHRLDDWNSYFDGSYIILEKYKGDSDSVVIPATGYIDGIEYKTVLRGTQDQDNTTFPSDLRHIRLEKNVKMAPNIDYLFFGIDHLVKLEMEMVDDTDVESMNGFVAGCIQLKSADFSGFRLSSVKNTEMMFRDCESITEVFLSPSFKIIGDYCVDGCDKLNTVYYDGTIAQWNNISIGKNNENLKLSTIVCSDGIISPDTAYYTNYLTKIMNDNRKKYIVNYLTIDSNFPHITVLLNNDTDSQFYFSTVASNAIFRGIDGWKDLFSANTSKENAIKILSSLLVEYDSGIQSLASTKTANKWAKEIVDISKEVIVIDNLDALSTSDIRKLKDAISEEKITNYLLDGKYDDLANKIIESDDFDNKSEILKTVQGLCNDTRIINDMLKSIGKMGEITKTVESITDLSERLYQYQVLRSADDMYLELLTYIRDNCYYDVVQDAAGEMIDSINSEVEGQEQIIVEAFHDWMEDKVSDAFLHDVLKVAEKNIPVLSIFYSVYKISVTGTNLVLHIDDIQKNKDNLRIFCYLGNVLARWEINNFSAFLQEEDKDEKEIYARKILSSMYLLLKTRMQGEESLQRLCKNVYDNKSTAYSTSKTISLILDSNENALFDAKIKAKLRGLAVMCPVDVDISIGEICVSLKDEIVCKGQENDIYYESYLDPWDEDYVKLMTFSDEDYRIDITGRNKGKIDLILGNITEDGKLEEYRKANLNIDESVIVSVDMRNYENEGYSVSDNNGIRTGSFYKSTDEKTAVEDISFTDDNLILKPGEEYLLGVEINPFNSTEQHPIYVSDNNDIAVVNNDGVVTAKEYGDAIISASVDGKETVCRVSVKADNSNLPDNPPQESENPASPKATPFDFSQYRHVTAEQAISSNGCIIARKGKFDVAAYIPGATRFISSNKKVVSVSRKKGLAKGKRTGDAVITGQVKSGKKWVDVGTYTIYVVEPVIDKDMISVLPARGYMKVDELIKNETLIPSKIVSSKPSVVVIDEKQDMLKVGYEYGASTITAYYGEGKNAARYKFSVRVRKGDKLNDPTTKFTSHN